MVASSVSRRSPLLAALPGIIGLVASLLGAFFAAFSTHDYVGHLDRKLHTPHCSFVPGLTQTDPGENACSTAMYSPYSAVFRETMWGGIPISLFGLGAFAFFIGASLYLLLGRDSASKRLRVGYLVATLGPAGASVVMFVISLTKLDALCKLCVGIYMSSLLLLIAGVLAVLDPARPRKAPIATPAAPAPKPDMDATALDPEPWHLKPEALRGVKPTVVDHTMTSAKPSREAVLPDEPNLPAGSWGRAVGFVMMFGFSSAVPAGVYAAAVPSYGERVRSCGTTEFPEPKSDERPTLVRVTTKNAKTPAISVEDPLCPMCQSFHHRLVKEGIYDTLDLKVLLFPLDSECNWMLARPRHPGACILSRATICGEKDGRARDVLDWAYDHQKELTEAGKQDTAIVRRKVVERFPELDACIDAKETKERLERILQLAVKAKLRTSTPQLFVRGQKLCAEDTDLGLPYAMRLLSSAKGGSK